MKQIYLIRHSEALVNPDLEDKQRPLTIAGKAKCIRVAEQLKKINDFPDHIICSAATRTKQTIETICAHLNLTIDSIFLDSLYYSAPGNIYEIIKKIDDKYKKVMIVSHNPTISKLARLLAHDPSHQYHSITNGFAPADCAKFEFDVNSWQDLKLSQGKILWEIIV